jgi:ribosome-associated protein
MRLTPSPIKMPNEMRDVDITREPVELFKVLKFEGMVSSGGEAKVVIADGLVRLNGQVETQKRKKIVSGDIIEFAGEQIRIRKV